MPPPALEVDLECESIARLSGDERAMSGAGRAPSSVGYPLRLFFALCRRCPPECGIGLRLQATRAPTREPGLGGG